MRFLLDANVLIAMTDTSHMSHARATKWFQLNCTEFATCPITQGALVRFILRTGAGSVHGAKAILEQVVAHSGHQFWADSVSFLEMPEKGVIGHRQVTDAYLVALARHYKGILATLDRPLAALHTAAAILVP